MFHMTVVCLRSHTVLTIKQRTEPATVFFFSSFSFFCQYVCLEATTQPLSDVIIRVLLCTCPQNRREERSTPALWFQLTHPVLPQSTLHYHERTVRNNWKKYPVWWSIEHTIYISTGNMLVVCKAKKIENHCFQSEPMMIFLKSYIQNLCCILSSHKWHLIFFKA